MEIRVEIGKQARQEIHEALAEEPLKSAALVVHSGNPDVCCTVGFEVLLVEKRDVPSKGFVMLGEPNGWPVYVSEEITPSGSSRLIINLDRTSGRLAGIFLNSGP